MHACKRPGRSLPLLAFALTLALVLPGMALAEAPAPLADPLGLVVPLPGCGLAGRPVSPRHIHQVRARGRVVRHRRARAAPALPAADTGALAWQALYGCTSQVPEEAGVTAGALPLRQT